ncbi:MAG: ABC transporter ATP-binding protein [Thermodesulfobacteriota bacterium]
MSTPIFAAQNLAKSYPTSDGELTILSDVNLQVAPGERVAIIGASGTGKTTLLHLFGALTRPTHGQLLFAGHDILEKSEEELAEFRNRAIGFVFQFHHLLPEFSALENTMMPAVIAGADPSASEDEARQLLIDVGLGQRLKQRVVLLSGGEQQRVALARALMMKPQLLLADEPTGNLDPETGGAVFDLLSRLSQARGLATIMVTHNHQLAGEMDRCFTLAHGRLTETPLP